MQQHLYGKPRCIGSPARDLTVPESCENNTFNGMPLPAIWARDAAGACRELVRFGYADFKRRLGS